MLFAKLYFSWLVDEGCEDDRELHSAEHVQVEWLNGHVIESCYIEPGFLSNLANRAILRTLVGIETAVNRFPRTGTAGVGRALHCKDLPPVFERTQEIDINDPGCDLRHAVVLHRVRGCGWLMP